VAAEQILAVASKVPQAEAMFFPPGTTLDDATLGSLRQHCPDARCISLGCEVTEQGYLELCRQHGQHDEALATALEVVLRLPEGVPNEPEPEFEPLLCRVLDLTDVIFARLTDAGFTEIPKFCLDVTAVFLPTDSQTTNVGLQEFRRQSPATRCLALGAEVQRGALLRMLNNAKATQTLDLTGSACGRLTTNGLGELAAICQPRGSFSLKAVIASQELRETAADGLAMLYSLHPSAHVVCVGDEVWLGVRQQATRAKEELDGLQEQLKSAAVADQSARDARDAARQRFIAAAEEYTAAFAKGSALADYLASCTESPAENPAELHGQLENLPVADECVSDVQKWLHVRAEADQLAVLAAECKHVVESSEPGRSKGILAELQAKDQDYRQELKTCQARIDIAKGEARASPRSEGRTAVQTTPEQQQARKVLLEHGVSNWSEEQVQDWIGLLGLTPEDKVAVQKALAANDTDGEDLEELTQKQWTKVLKKSGVDSDKSAALSEKAFALHQGALGGATAQSKLLVAQAELAAARKALRENSLAMRSRVVRLVSLTSRHFPELKEHPDVLAFMGSDGLDASDRRRIADYDDVRPLATGRNELLRAKYGGADICLKAFPLQGDMGAYKREFLRVQQLRHPYIVRYTAAFEDSGTMYLEMEYYKHGSLRNWLETTEPDALQKRAVLRQVLLALACVHSQGIVHSDIKGEVRVYTTLSPVSSVCVFSTCLFS
jgi:hypothetical protein